MIKLLKKSLCILLVTVLIVTIDIPTFARADMVASGFEEESVFQEISKKSIITINGKEYNADQFMDRVISCTRVTEISDERDVNSHKITEESSCLDIEQLFGDQYMALKESYESAVDNDSPRISSNEIQSLLYAASLNYDNGLRFNLEAQTGSDWYTRYENSGIYYLIARIIYGENSYRTADNTQNIYLKYNRQGVGWEIINRLLEDECRERFGYNYLFSVQGTENPSFYSVLTKPYAFTSLNSDNATSAISIDNVAYQEAFWISSCMHVCNTYEEWNAVVPRPAGITYQCYNRGVLNANSAPANGWANVVFPGWNTDYSGQSNYSAFPYYEYIFYYNVMFSQTGETLYMLIKEDYY